MFAVMVGVCAIVLAGILALVEITCLYVLIACPLSGHGRLEALLVLPFLAICIYSLLRLARYAFRGKHKPGWQKADAYLLLISGLVAYGGSIPWVAYLVLTEDRRMWWLLLVCVPLYGSLTWTTIQAFSHRMGSIKNGENQSSPLPGARAD